jgi:WXG100 family type VII secretion target
MAGQIRITPDQMRARSGEYTTEAGKVDDVIAKMDQLLSALQSEWEGDAAESYSQRFTELRPGFVKAKELIDEIAQALNKTADVVQETDERIASGFRS